MWPEHLFEKHYTLNLPLRPNGQLKEVDSRSHGLAAVIPAVPHGRVPPASDRAVIHDAAHRSPGDIEDCEIDQCGLR